MNDSVENSSKTSTNMRQNLLSGQPDSRSEKQDACAGAQQLIQAQLTVIAGNQRKKQDQSRAETGDRVDQQGEPESGAEQAAYGGGERVEQADQDASADHPEKDVDLSNRGKEHG